LLQQIDKELLDNIADGYSREQLLAQTNLSENQIKFYYKNIVQNISDFLVV